MAVRYAIIALLFALILVYFIGGYYHAKRRASKGLPPLAYHRWMVNRRSRNNYNQQYYNPVPYAQPYYQSHDNSYGMQGYAPPPPAYDGYAAPPPVYQPPQGGSKVAADQNYAPPQRVGESSEATAAPRA
jgi:hypothetical protein